MLGKYALPQMKITVTHSATDYDFSEGFERVDVTLRENAVNSCRIVLNDDKSETFETRCNVADNLKVEFRYQDKTTSYTQLFGGLITDIQPTRGDAAILNVTALGYEAGLVNMLVQQQYGSETSNPTLNTLQEILTNATYGIIPKYVQKVLASATDSGYTIDTTKVANVTSDYRFLFFTGKPASKCLEDMIHLISAANAPNAGVHWTAIYSGTTCYLCVATLLAHENPPADIWTNYFNDSGVLTSASYIVEDLDILSSPQSWWQKKRSEANYIYSVADFRRPSNGDKWTESASASWGDTYSNIDFTDDTTYYKIGANSLRGNIPTSGQTGLMFYPSTYNMNFDFTKIGTKLVIPHIGFYARVTANVWRGGIDYNGPDVVCGTGNPTSGNFYEFHLAGYGTDLLSQPDKWLHISLPVGPYASLDETNTDEWFAIGSPSWADIDYIGFLWKAGSANASWYIDGLGIHGRIIRGASASNKYASQKCKMKFIRDDVPKDDSLVASDDSGEIAQFAKGELYRSVATPIYGQAAVPLQEMMKGGHLAYIMACKRASGYGIDTTMRITEVTHSMSQAGAISLLTLTTDCANSLAVGPVDAYRALIHATEPNFRDRYTASLVTGDLDTVMTLFEKDYTIT